MSIVVLEGTDCTGKSTLANELSKRTEFEIIQGSSFEISKLGADGMFEYMMGLLDKKDIIIDRFFMSNYVYGNLYNYPTMTDKQFVELAKKSNKKALTIYLTANPHTIKSRMLERGDDMIKVDEIDSILNKYSEAINNGILAQKLTLHINTSYTTNINYTASMITNFLDQQQTDMFIYS